MIKLMAPRDRRKQHSSPKSRDDKTHTVETAPELVSVDVPCECQTCITRMEFNPKLARWTIIDRSAQDEPTSKKIIEFNFSLNAGMRQMLQMLVKVYGRRLVQQWRAKTFTQRCDAIKSSEPGLCHQDHSCVRRMFDIWDRGIPAGWDQKEFVRGEFRAPYLNLQRLCANTSRFLSLLWYRTSLHPSDFAIRDAYELRNGYSTSSLPMRLLSGMVAINAPLYGTWTPLDLSKIHDGSHFSASKALIVCEIQQILFSFLLGTTTRLADDGLPVLPTFEDGLREPQQKTQTLNEICQRLSQKLGHISPYECRENAEAVFHYVINCPGWTPNGTLRSFIASYESIPFSDPSIFPIKHLISITKDRQAEAEDELWLIQTDPSYLLRRIRSFEKHSHRQIRGNIRSRETIKLGEIVSDIIWKPAHDYVQWNAILQQLSVLQGLRKKHESTIRSATSLPTAYDIAISSFCVMAKSMQNNIRQQLNLRAASISILEPYFSREQTLDSRTGMMMVKTQVTNEAFQRLKKDKVAYLLAKLCSENEELLYRNLPQALHILDGALALCTQEKAARLDPFMYAMLSDLAVLEEMITACSLHSPSHRIMSYEECLNVETPYWQYQQARHHKASGGFLHEGDVTGIIRSLRPLHNLKMPRGSHDERWLTQTKRARSSLFDIWVEAEKVVTSYCDRLEYQGPLREPFHRSLRFYKDRKFLDEIEAEYQAVQAEIEETNALQQMASLNFRSNHEAEAKKPEPAYVKQKIKTRGQPTETESASIAPVQSDAETLTAQTAILYRLESAHFRVITHLFPSAQDPAGSFKTTFNWTDFVSTMGKLGFEVQSRGGSAHSLNGKIQVVDAEGKAQEQQRSIVVHRPHPDPEMGPDVLRAIGRRCGKHFGWRREHFAEE